LMAGTFLSTIIEDKCISALSVSSIIYRHQTSTSVQVFHPVFCLSIGIVFDNKGT
jgi:hypothetical protein